MGPEPQLFQGSVRDNVTLAHPDLPEATLWQILEQVGMAEWVRSRPEGLDSLLGEDSGGVSVGQAQRLALARALVQDASLFVLDEPTASLDAAHAESVRATLQQAMQGRSAVVVTHRLDRLDAADALLVLRQGQVVQQGTFAELSARPGLLADLCAEQASWQTLEPVT